MKAGIVGKPASGKTSLMQALTRGHFTPPHAKEPAHSVVVVPDPRFDRLVGIYSPKKITPGSIDFVDDAARLGEERGREFSDSAMAELRLVDAIVCVVNAFDPPDIAPEAAAAEARALWEEMIFRDLMLMEGRLERLEKQLRTHSPPQSLLVEQQVIKKVKEVLEKGQPASSVDLVESERKAVAGFQMLSGKPLLVAFNVHESVVQDAEARYTPVIQQFAAQNIDAFWLSAEVERQVAELPDEEQEMFLEELGIKEPAFHRLIREVYRACSLVTFFTVSEKEVHAWPLPAGSTALEAADSIHSDLARGFIRAEVTSYADIDAYNGWDEAKAAGKQKLVGKEHIVEDGDCLYIRFKV